MSLKVVMSRERRPLHCHALLHCKERLPPEQRAHTFDIRRGAIGAPIVQQPEASASVEELNILRQAEILQLTLGAPCCIACGSHAV
ncbi:hypothetical protein DQ04_17021000 [Trypanosoma grayi]|uniref:hypothetical protein n=1 Tax=Trypanosoma grayi TaxID=71804 RepID=UPI0004F43C3E|nr:hypothetical protein DQ04_17021000 [Trypanosoma grayi]KEG05957.1 hypothetical protein DQ04_17021000 [Trypanosoma grayi]